MSPHHRSWCLALLVALVALLPARPAAAWLETRVTSDSVDLALDRDGAAVVTHDLLLRVRGGPLKDFVIEGVDGDAEPLPDATVTRARSGRAAGLPIPLTLSVEEGALRAHVGYKKGLRTGTYRLKLGYRADLSGRIHPAGSRAELSWRGPRFDSGIDSVRVVLRVPRGTTPPALPSDGASDDALGIEQEPGGVFLSTLRRGDDRDELEIVRPHVARDERVVWRARVDPGSFDLPLAQTEPPKRAPVAPAPPERRSGRPWALAGLVGLVYGLLVFGKARLVAIACGQRKAMPKPLVPLRPSLRSLGAALAVAAAVVAVLLFGTPTAYALLLALAMGLAVHRPPVAPTPLRGPGRWERLPVSELDSIETGPRPRGAVLDAGTVLGFVVFLLALAGFVVAAAVAFVESPYHGLVVALSSVVLFPIFLTGRAAELPADPVGGPVDLLRRAARRLERQRKASLTVLARIPDAAEQPDELRLLLQPKRPAPGLVAIELGVDFHHGGGASLPLPYVIVRVREGSPCFEALPRGLYWTRGRTPDERVAVVRPRLPTVALWVRLAARLAELSSQRSKASKRRQAARSAAGSGGKAAAATAKPSAQASPAHAT